MSKTKRRRLTCAICPIYTASNGWCAVRACRRPADAAVCEYGRKLIRRDQVCTACRRLRGKSADGSDSRTYNRRAPKVQLILTRSISAADAMTRHLRKNHGYFGAAAEVKAGGQN
jgi:hypothetical protein